MSNSKVVKTSSVMELLEIRFEDIIREDTPIGTGAFGVVYKGVWVAQTVAIKESKADDQKSYTEEARKLARATHPNIVQIYGIYCRNSRLCLVMEFAECGSLHHAIHKCELSYTHGDCLNWARQCAEGIAYLHGMKPKPLIHRDIKPANLLLFENRTLLKIGDFGTVRDASNEMSVGRGSAPWMAPEVSGTARYNEKCDVYSWAIVLWEILTREHPFEECENVYAIVFSVHKGRRPATDLATITKPLKDLMIRCWQHDPDLRPAMESVVDEMTLLCNEARRVDEPSLSSASSCSSCLSFHSATEGEIFYDCNSLGVGSVEHLPANNSPLEIASPGVGADAPTPSSSPDIVIEMIASVQSLESPSKRKSKLELVVIACCAYALLVAIPVLWHRPELIKHIDS